MNDKCSDCFTCECDLSECMAEQMVQEHREEQIRELEAEYKKFSESYILGDI